MRRRGSVLAILWRIRSGIDIQINWTFRKNYFFTRGRRAYCSYGELKLLVYLTNWEILFVVLTQKQIWFDLDKIYIGSGAPVTLLYCDSEKAKANIYVSNEWEIAYTKDICDVRCEVQPCKIVNQHSASLTLSPIYLSIIYFKSEI